MDIDRRIASALGFPNPDYTVVERERRWLSRMVPREMITRTDAITDLYITGTQLRLREARPIDGGAAMLRLTRKAEIDARTRLVTSIYLSEKEFAVLAASLPGARISKFRHKLKCSLPGMAILVDEFCEELAGLVIAEADFEAPDLLAEFPMPDFAIREVTNDPRFTGGHLASNGLPKDL